MLHVLRSLNGASSINHLLVNYHLLTTTSQLRIQRDGVLSGNACLLKRVSEMMAMQAGHSNSSNSCEARRALLALEVLLNPSSVSLPAVPSATLAKKFLTNRNTSVTTPDLQLEVEVKVDTHSSDALHRDDDMEEGVGVASKEHSAEGVPSRTKRGREEAEEGGDDGDKNVEGGKKRVKKDELKSFVANPSIGAAFGSQSKKSGDVNKGEEEEDDDDDDDDDDDSLPDINIEADPEK